MSNSQAYDEVTVTDHGVTVVKQFEEDEFPVPAIAFEFSSHRDEPVTVELVDSVPESVAVEDLGFHPEYGSEHWTIDEDHITFERKLEADAEYTTVYGIRATGTDEVEQFLTAPELVEVDPPLDDEDQSAVNGDEIVAEGDDIVRDVLADESEDTDVDEDTDEEIETLELADPNDDGQAQSGSPSRTPSTGSTEPDTTDDESPEQVTAEERPTDPDDADAGSSDDEDSPESTGINLAGESLISALADELREDDVAEEDVELLRQAFDIVDEQDGSIEARVQRIQRDVSDLRAYTDALEEFLDENGGAERVLEDVQADIDSLEETVTRLEASVSEHEDRLSTVDDVETSLVDVEADVSDVEAAVEDLKGQVDGSDVVDRLDEIEQDIEELRTWQDRIQETFGG